MNPNYGCRLCQAQRTKTRAEVIAGGARLGRQAAGHLGSACNCRQDRPA
jgi:hypothetical protein